MSRSKALALSKAKQKRHGRKVTNKVERSKTLIVCEGTSTEPNYFKDKARHLKLTGTKVKVMSGRRSNPSAVLKTAIEEYNENREYEYIFVVVDVDQHGSDLQKAIKQLKDHQFSRRVKDGSKLTHPIVQLLISKPCIEVWFILHFELLQKPFAKNRNSSAVNCKNYLKQHHIVDYSENISNLYFRLETNEPNACRNALKLKELNQKSGSDELDTDVYLLIQHLNQMRIHFS